MDKLEKLDEIITELIVNQSIKSKRIRIACEQFISEAENINDEEVREVDQDG